MADKRRDAILGSRHPISRQDCMLFRSLIDRIDWGLGGMLGILDDEEEDEENDALRKTLQRDRARLEGFSSALRRLCPTVLSEGSC